MKKTLFFTIVSTSLLIGVPVAAKVVISQIKISGITATDEYVELYNTSSTPADITSWSLKKRTAGGTESNLVSAFASQLLQPFSYLLIAHRNYSNTTTPPDVFYSGSDSLAANNSALLYNADKTLIDLVAWGTVSTSVGSPAPNPSNNTILTRLPNDATGNGTDSDDSGLDFIETNGLPHTNQPITPPPDDTPSTTTPLFGSVTTIILNEIMPNPADGPEWVELYNPTDILVDLTGAALCDGRAGHCTIAELTGTIDPHGFTVVYLKSNYLNNDGDTVILLSDSSTIDTITYASLASNQTMARKTDGANEWSVTISPTPGTANISTAPPSPTIASSSGGSSIAENTPIKTSKPKTETPEEQKTSIIFKTTLPIYGQVGTTSTFAITSAADPRGGSVFSAWNFGDGTTLDGNTVQHTFVTSGVHLITISATSTRGTTSSKQISFNVYDAPTTTAIRIEEIYTYPRSDEDSFIELYNTTSGTVDISNWLLTTSADKKFTIPSSTTIPAYSYNVFSKLATGLTLEHGNEIVSLWSEKHALYYRANIATSTKGKSFSNTVNGWITNDPTPGTPAITSEILGEKITASTANKKTVKQRAAKAVTSVGKSGTIAHTRTLSKNSFVTVVGHVTVAPEQLSKHYLYIADDTGGIQIYSTLPLPALTEKDVVRVQGKMSSANGILRITVPKTGSITKIKTVEPLQPSTKMVDDTIVGQLVVVTGEITEVASNHLYLDTGETEIRVRLTTQMKPNLRVRDQASITGILEMNGAEFILIPRNQNDIEALADTPTPPKKKSFFLFNLFQ